MPSKMERIRFQWSVMNNDILIFDTTVQLYSFVSLHKTFVCVQNM